MSYSQAHSNWAPWTLERTAIERILPYERNARKIPQAAIDAVATSIREHGFVQELKGTVSGDDAEDDYFIDKTGKPALVPKLPVRWSFSDGLTVAALQANRSTSIIAERLWRLMKSIRNCGKLPPPSADSAQPTELRNVSIVRKRPMNTTCAACESGASWKHEAAGGAVGVLEAGGKRAGVQRAEHSRILPGTRRGRALILYVLDVTVLKAAC